MKESKVPNTQPDSSPESEEDFGNTKSVQGFVRLVQFIKREHERRKLTHDPKFQVRQQKVEKYRLAPAAGSSKKGLQLKKAA